VLQTDGQHENNMALPSLEETLILHKYINKSRLIGDARRVIFRYSNIEE